MKDTARGSSSEASHLLEEYEISQADLEKIRLKYHLGVTGGSGKGVFVAIAVAVLAVAGVLGWALTRPEPENGNGNGHTGPVPPRSIRSTCAPRSDSSRAA